MNLFEKLKKVAGMDQASLDKESTLNQYQILDDDPIDVVFAKTLIQNNGIFFYCDTQNALVKTIEGIIKKLNTEMIYCNEVALQKLLLSSNVQFEDSNYSKCHLTLSSCEYLIANQAKIMLSSKQLKSNNIKNLPQEHVVIAYTSQIVRNLNEAMSGINTRYIDNLPSTITTITSKQDSNSKSEGNVKKLSVVLIEDFKSKKYSIT